MHIVCNHTLVITAMYLWRLGLGFGFSFSQVRSQSQYLSFYIELIVRFPFSTQTRPLKHLIPVCFIFLSPVTPHDSGTEEYALRKDQLLKDAADRGPCWSWGGSRIDISRRDLIDDRDRMISVLVICFELKCVFPAIVIGMMFLPSVCFKI